MPPSSSVSPSSVESKDDKVKKEQYQFFILTQIALVVYLCLVTWGIRSSRNNGLLTISDFLSQNDSLTIVTTLFMVALIFAIIKLLVLRSIRRARKEKKPRKQLKCCSSWADGGANIIRNPDVADRAIDILVLFQLTAFALIPVARVNEVPLGHYVLAGLTMAFTLALHLILINIRWSSSRQKHHTFFLYANALCLLFIFVLALVFVILQYSVDYMDRFYPINLTEYLLYLTIIQIKIFHVLDTD